ncbi:hypothetical protein HDZ31DRAFT_76313 [Schizophyllum fasciatum]
MAADVPSTEVLDTHLAKFLQAKEDISLIWAPSPNWPIRPLTTLSILDSSFNPPTRAHVALAALSHATDTAIDPLLLLLSVQNADKPPPDPSRDASYAQRLQMMIILARHLGPRAAVGVTIQPTFVGKARALRAWLGGQSLNGNGTRPELAFLVGYDTLQRILAPKYYGGAEAMRAALRGFFEDGARLVVARRDAAAYPAFAGASDMPVLLQEFRDGIEMRDFENEEGISADGLTMISSSAVRKAVAEGDPGWLGLVPLPISEYVRESGLY